MLRISQILCEPTYLVDEKDHAAEVDGELGHHGQDGVHVEDVGQRPLL